MKNKPIALIILILIISSATKAQDTGNVFGYNFDKLKPIIQVFGTASYSINENYYNYEFGRTHIGLQYQFNEKWSSKVIIDRGRPSTITEISVTDSLGNLLTVNMLSGEGSYYTMWLKFASLQFRVNDQLTLEGGAILQNHYITQERFWGLRYIAQTFQDLYWRTPSSDLGFIAYYKLNSQISLDAAVTNGEGPRVKQDMYGKVKLAGGISIEPFSNVQMRIFYHNRKSGIEGTSTEQLVSVFAGFKPSDTFRVGGEFNYLDNVLNINNSFSYGYSVYGALRVRPAVEIFARFDRLICSFPENSSQTGYEDGKTFILGASCTPVTGVHFSLNYQTWIPDPSNNTTKNIIGLAMEYKY